MYVCMYVCSGWGMCVDTRVIPIALSEHTLTHSPTYGVRVAPHLPTCVCVRVRACVRACVRGYHYVCVSPMRVATAYLCVRPHTHTQKTLRHLTIDT